MAVCYNGIFHNRIFIEDSIIRSHMKSSIMRSPLRKSPNGSNYRKHGHFPNKMATIFHKKSITKHTYYNIIYTIPCSKITLSQIIIFIRHGSPPKNAMVDIIWLGIMDFIIISPPQMWRYIIAVHADVVVAIRPLLLMNHVERVENFVHYHARYKTFTLLGKGNGLPATSGAKFTPFFYSVFFQISSSLGIRQTLFIVIFSRLFSNKWGTSLNFKIRFWKHFGKQICQQKFKTMYKKFENNLKRILKI